MEGEPGAGGAEPGALLLKLLTSPDSFIARCRWEMRRFCWRMMSNEEGGGDCCSSLEAVVPLVERNVEVMTGRDGAGRGGGPIKDEDVGRGLDGLRLREMAAALAWST